jgi:hypothetical protein
MTARQTVSRGTYSLVPVVTFAGAFTERALAAAAAPAKS